MVIFHSYVKLPEGISSKWTPTEPIEKASAMTSWPTSSIRGMNHQSCLCRTSKSHGVDLILLPMIFPMNITSLPYFACPFYWRFNSPCSDRWSGLSYQQAETFGRPPLAKALSKLPPTALTHRKMASTGVIFPIQRGDFFWVETHISARFSKWTLHIIHILLGCSPRWGNKPMPMYTSNFLATCMVQKRYFFFLNPSNFGMPTWPTPNWPNLGSFFEQIPISPWTPRVFLGGCTNGK